MATRTPQTQAKRAREVALRERRDRKREKKAARRAAGAGPVTEATAADQQPTEG
jgi:hypothetical protein